MRSFIAVLPVVFLAACSSSSSDSDGAVIQSDLTSSASVSQCPRELRVKVGYGTAIVDYATSARGLNAFEIERLDAAWDDVRDLGDNPLFIEAGTPLITADSCVYSQPGVTAVLHTKTGEARLDITTGHLRIQAYPKRFAPEGIRIDDDSSRDNLLAIVSDPQGGGAEHLVVLGDQGVDVVGEQIARYASISALRLPVLQQSLAPVSELHASYYETLLFDADHGPAKYERYAREVEINAETQIHPYRQLLRKATPTTFQTDDPDTTICFVGPGDGICPILASFAGNVFSDGFTFGDDCHATETSVTMTYRISASPDPTTMTIPRCQ